jgi:hypothetical protein
VTTESRQIKLVCKLASGSKSLVGVSGSIQISGAAFRVGDASQVAVTDSSKGANLLADVKALDDGSEVIKFGYFASVPVSAGESLFQLVLIPTGTVIVSGSSVEVDLKNLKTTVDGFQFETQADSRVVVSVAQSNNTRPRFTLTSTVEFFRSRANELQLVASDLESPAGDLKYSLVGAPAGMIVSATGLVRWNPGQDVAVGQGRFTAQVEDPEGGKDSQEILYTVREAQALSLRLDQSWIVESASTRYLQLTLTIADLPQPINGVQFKVAYPAHLRLAPSPREPRFLGDFAKSSVAALVSENATTRTVSAVANSLDSVGAKGQSIFQMTLIPDDSVNPGADPQFGLSQIYQSSAGTLTPVTSMSVPVANPSGSKPVFRGLAEALVDEETELKLQLEATDADLPAQPLSFGLVSGPAGMKVTPDGLLSWTPTEVQGGQSYPVQVRVSDGVLDANGSFTVVVRKVNWPPEASSQSLTVIQGNSLGIVLSGSDRDGDLLKFFLVGSPTKGQLTGTPPNLTYRPNPDQLGSDQLTFRVNDGLANSPLTTVSIQILPANAIPVATAQAVTTDEDVPKAITLAGTDVEGSTLTYALVSAPTKGALSGTVPNLTYTPNANVSGSDSLTFKVNNGVSDSAVAAVTITITAVNDAPVATAQTVTTDEDVPKAITLTGTDVEGSTLTYTVVIAPTKGVLSGTAPNLIYTPNANVSGSDSFTFNVNDGTLDSAVATVAITIAAVNDAPVATAQTVTTDEDVPKAITLAGTDVEGATLSYTLLTVPSNGTLKGVPPNLIYQPNPNYNGSDSFQFRVHDGAVVSSAATVSIEIQPVNDAPIITAVKDQVAESGKGLDISISASDVDVPNQVLSFRLKSGPPGMTVNTSGRLIWLPRSSQRPSSQRITVEVSDGVDTSETSFNVDAKAALLTTVFNGVAIDGYIAGARVWFDADLDGNWDPDEPTTTTDRSGNFNLDFDSSVFDRNGNGKLESSEGRLVVEGGIDLSSGQPRVGQLTAPPGSQVITPITTMVDLISRQGAGLSAAAAEEKVRTALGLPAAVSLTTFDPIEAAIRGDAQAAAVQLASASIADTISLLAGVIDGASATVDARAANAAVTEVLAARIANTPIFDFGSSALLQDTVSAAAAAVSAVVPVEVKAAVSQVVAEQNAAKQESVANSWNPLEALNALSQAQSVAQGETASALTELGAGALSADEVRILYTGDALDQAIASAPIGDVTGTNVQPGTFEFSDASSVVVEGGRVVQPLSVIRKGGSYGAVTVLVQLTGATGVMVRDTISLIFADGATQMPIDLGSLPLDDAIPHLDRAVTASLALGPGFPSGAAISGVRQSSIRVIDNDATGAIGFTQVEYRGTEGSPVTVGLERVNGTSGRIVAQIRLSGGTAQSGADYASSVIPIQFEPGQSRLIVNLGWLVDGVQESAESVNATLELLSGSDPGATLTLGQQTTLVTVVDPVLPPPNNQAPVAIGVAEGPALSVVEGQKLGLTLLGRDPEGAALNFVRVGSPSKGVLSGKPPALVYTANMGQSGEDAFSFKVNDGQLDSAVLTVRIMVETANVAPVALSQVLTTEVSKPLGFRLGGQDAEGDPLTYRVVAAPGQGTITGNSPDLVYTPKAGFTGMDQLDFVANDGRKDSKPQTIWIVVSKGNALPLAFSQSLVVREDATVGFTLSGMDPEGAVLTYQVIRAPAHGKLTGTPPDLVYTPDGDFNGSDSMAFRVSDGVNFSETAAISWVVQAVNDAPVGIPQRLEFTYGVPRSIILSGSDVDGDLLTFRILTQPSRGSLVGSGSAFTYVPTSVGDTEDWFSFEVDDGLSKSAPVRISLAPNAINQPPTAKALTLSGSEDVAMSVTLVGVDPEGKPVTYEIVTPPSQGTLSGLAPNLTYTPKTNVLGQDVIVYRVSDGQKFSETAQVTLWLAPVNDAPFWPPMPDVVIGAGKFWNLKLNANDVETPSHWLTYSLLKGPVGLNLNADGNLEWTPNTQQLGSHPVQVSVSDGALASEIQFQISVEPINTPPQLPSMAPRRVSEGNAVSFMLSATDADQPAQRLTYGLVSGPEGLSISANGQLSWQPTEAQGPSTNLIWVKVTDDGKPNLSVTNSIQIVVREVNQPPVLSILQALEFDALKSSKIALGGQDADIPAQTLTYRLLKGPQGLTLSSQGVVEWTPTLAQQGSHDLEVSLGDGVTVVSKMLSMRVRVINTPPILAPIGTRRVAEGSQLTFALSASDAEQAIQRLVFGLVRGPDGLTVSSNGLVNWKPTEVQGPSTNQVLVCVTDDGQPSLSHTNSIEIIVREINQSPVAIAVPTRRVSEGNTLSFTMTATDADLPQQRLTFSLVSGPEGLTVAPGGAVAWKPTENQGPSTNWVMIRIADDGAPSLSITNLVEIVVREVNVAPQFSALGPKAVRPGSDWSLQLSASDSDLPAQVLSYKLVSGPSGMLVGTNGMLSWKPTVSQVGVHPVTVSVSDGVTSVDGAFSMTVADPIEPRLELIVGADQSMTLRVYGLAGFRHQVEVSQSLGGLWSAPSGLPEIGTLGFQNPVEVPLKSLTGDLHFIRIRPSRP